MDLKTALAEEHSKFQTDLIATYIGKNQKRFDELMTFVLDHGEAGQDIASRAAWVMRECTDRHPAVITPHLAKIVESLQMGVFNTAVKRQCTGFLQSIPLPSRIAGPAFRLLLPTSRGPRRSHRSPGQCHDHGGQYLRIGTRVE